MQALCETTVFSLSGSSKYMAFVLVAFLTLNCGLLFSQQITSRKISFEASREPLASVLTRLAESEKLNFTFNPSDETFGRLVTYRAVSLPLDQVISDILNQTGHSHRIVGNQIVVFLRSLTLSEPKKSSTGTTAHPTLSGASLETSPVPVSGKTAPDTVYISDTLFISDTIYISDTIRITDTVFIEKVKNRHPRKRNQTALRENMFRQEPDRNNGWYFETAFMPFIPGRSYKSSIPELAQKLKEAESYSPRNYTVSARLYYNLNGFQFSGGLGYSQITSRFRYSYEIVKGGYFQNDTIDRYYTVGSNPYDTIWFYIIDKVWVPIAINRFDTESLNSLRYLEIPLGISYTILQSPVVKWESGLDVIMAFPVETGGFLIDADPPNVTRPLGDCRAKTPYFAWAIHSRLRYRVSSHSDLVAGLRLNNPLSGIIEGYPVEIRIRMYTLVLGACFYF